MRRGWAWVMSELVLPLVNGSWGLGAGELVPCPAKCSAISAAVACPQLVLEWYSGLALVMVKTPICFAPSEPKTLLR